jgi:hypothetical protein
LTLIVISVSYGRAVVAANWTVLSSTHSQRPGTAGSSASAATAALRSRIGWVKARVGFDLTEIRPPSGSGSQVSIISRSGVSNASVWGSASGAPSFEYASVTVSL